MFDLARIAEQIGGLIGQSASEALSQDLFTQLTEHGFDPSQLADMAGLDPTEILARLSESGIDVSQFAPDQLAELASQLNLDQIPKDWL